MRIKLGLGESNLQEFNIRMLWWKKRRENSSILYPIPQFMQYLLGETLWTYGALPIRTFTAALLRHRESRWNGNSFVFAIMWGFISYAIAGLHALRTFPNKADDRSPPKHSSINHSLSLNYTQERSTGMTMTVNTKYCTWFAQVILHSWFQGTPVLFLQIVKWIMRRM